MGTAVRRATPGKPLDAGRRAHGPGKTKDNVARGLGWFSVALGVPQVVAPRAVERLIGIPDTEARRQLMRLVGLRELVAAAGILTRPKPSGWLWARVAGDVTHLMLLGAALRSPDSGRRRVTMAIAAVAGVAVVDVIASVRAGRASDGADGVMRST
ncbi:MAG: hypothetical protein M3M94_00930, partial [Actinomycetota bacterium]|nr:hypothetical protein [Actinomycetota bacterium]